MGQFENASMGSHFGAGGSEGEEKTQIPNTKSQTPSPKRSVY